MFDQIDLPMVSFIDWLTWANQPTSALHLSLHELSHEADSFIKVHLSLRVMGLTFLELAEVLSSVCVIDCTDA